MLDRKRIQDATKSAGRHLAGRHRGEYETGEGVSVVFPYLLTRIEEHPQILPGNISTAHVYLSVFSFSFIPFLPIHACLLYIDSSHSWFILLLHVFSRSSGL